MKKRPTVTIRFYPWYLILPMLLIVIPWLACVYVALRARAWLRR